MSTPLGSSQWMYASGEEVTQQSLKFNDDESQYLSWTPAAAGNRKTWTWSGWVKRGNIGVNSSLFSAAGNYYDLRFTTSDTLLFYGNGTDLNYQTTIVYRDTSAWYHVVVALDTTQSTTLDRVKIYVNGEQQTSFSSTISTLNAELAYNNTVAHAIGRRESTSNFYADGYLSDVYFIDGQALDPTSFGQFTNGYWEKKDYAGSYGTNGFHLTFQDDVVSEGFNCITYTGNGGTQSLSGLGMAADLVWIKERSSTSGHVLTDTVRGVNKHLVSSSTGAETTISNGLTSFDSDGFSVGSNGAYNQSGETYVAWAWDAGSGSPVSNTDGTITSTVKANPDYGFSIVSYTGTGSSGTIGHGLSGKTPELIITKQRSATNPWPVNSGTLFSSGNMMFLDRTDAEAFGGSNALTSYSGTTFGVSAQGATGAINDNGQTYIAYCFAEVAGYSSIGSYTGSGVSGNSITGLGFKPAWLMIKSSAGATNDWFIYDNTRQPTNPKDLELYANLSSAEYDSGRNVTFTDDGFDLDTVNYVNNSGVTYIYMAFADTREAAFWKDVSGQGNHWQPNNLDYRDSLPDSPANNFAVMNALDKTSITLSEGNLRPTPTGDFKGVRGSFAIPLTGKWFFEAGVITGGGGNITDMSIGIATDQNVLTGTSPYPQEATYGVVYKLAGTIGRLGSNVQTGLPSFAAGDVLGVAINSTDNEVQFYKNGSTVGSAVGLPSTTRESFAFFVGATSRSSIFNFGQDSTFAGAKPMGAYTDDSKLGTFQYAPPTGYLALCTQNLPTPTIIDGSEYFNTVLYTGDGTSSRGVTGINFAPDWVWLKTRSTTGANFVYDTVRGATKGLHTNLTDAETTYTDGLLSFDSDGFTVGSRSNHNGSSTTMVSWNWKAGGTAVSNTDGSITSQVSANTAAGFSIVSYTGNGSNQQSIGHGLSTSPDMVIIKDRNNADNWYVYHIGTSIPYNRYLQLNSTAAEAASTAFFWNSGNANTFGLSNSGSVTYTNESGVPYIAYCFANTDGYLKAGSYTGNSSADGTFVYTGFRPAWVLWKSATSAGDDWFIVDSTRSTFNVVDTYSRASQSTAEQTFTLLDFVSNGFKIRASSGAVNDATTFIYLAFAETPFKYANAR